MRDIARSLRVWMPALARTVAVALAVVLIAAVTVGPRFLPAAAPDETEPADATPSVNPEESPTLTPEVSPSGLSRAIQHIATSELDFDVPGDWTSRQFNLPFSAIPDYVPSEPVEEGLNNGLAPILTVGTGGLTEVCANPTPEQMLAGLHDATCTATWTLPAGSVQLRLVFDGRTGTFEGCCKGIYSVMTAPIEAPPAGSEPIEVGGLQARVTRVESNQDPLTGETIPDADEIVEYRVVAPAWPFYGYVVTAALRGPGLVELEAQVEAAMASLTYKPAITPMPADQASLRKALRSSLDLIDRVNGCEGCDTRAEGFVDTPGATNTATITRIAFESNRKLLRPLKVRCTATIEPTGVDYWLLELTYEWDATGAYAAGTATATYIVPRDMSFPLGVAPQAAPTNEDAMPYISPAHPYNPG